jgi:predicted nucleic acid-binding protein
VKNVTLSVDESVLSSLRRHAVERNSTVNALVRDYLTYLATHEDRAKPARARLKELSKQSRGRFGKKTWPLEELHDGWGLLRQSERHRISYWDAAILVAADALGAKNVYSEDLNVGQQYGRVQVVNPFT